MFEKIAFALNDGILKDHDPFGRSWCLNAVRALYVTLFGVGRVPGVVRLKGV